MNKLQTYARIVLKTGINLRKGQSLRILTTAEDYNFARTLGEEAYAAGAKYVHIQMADNFLYRSRLNAQDGDDLDYLPRFMVSFHKEMLDDDWATIRIAAVGEGDVLKDVDASRLVRNRKAEGRLLNFHSKSLMADEHPWCVIAVPGPSWAEKVLGSGASTEDLWKVIDPILRLDKADPLQAQIDLNHSIHKRCADFNALQFDRIRFQSEGTDLTVGLSERSRWCGGPMPLPSGRMYNANIPSEEVYTTPDWRRTEGRVKISRPVSIMEKQVRGVEFVFEKGKVVEFSAEVGQDVLKEYLETDEGASYLGEVALVSNESPISRSGLIFHSTLYDENASCHIALGAGYPSCLEGFKELDTTEKLKDEGCNDSLVHTDFMIGTDDTRLTAYRNDGSEVVIMEDGNFTL